MSIQERLERLQEESLQERLRLEAARKEEEGRKGRLYSEGLKDAQRQQAALLEELREIGIVPMIEEFTGWPILPINTEDHTPKTFTTEEAERVKQKLRDLQKGGKMEEVFRRRETSEWMVEVPMPRMLESGEASPTLVIKLTRLSRSLSSWNEPIAFASVSYDPYKQFEIAGRKTTYKGIPQDGEERHEVIEEALAQAIHDPERIERPRPLPLPNEPIRMGF